ncbi:MAG: hypothetical protein ACLQVI_30065 [Polyangiaceae bacterium]
MSANANAKNAKPATKRIALHKETVKTLGLPTRTGIRAGESGDTQCLCVTDPAQPFRCVCEK